MIDKELFELYRRALDGNISLLNSEFDAIIGQFKDLSNIELRRQLKSLYIQLIKQYGSFASVAAMEFYETVREQAQLQTRYQASAFAPDNDELLVFDAKQLIKGADLEKIVSNLKAQATQRTMQYADETLFENAKVDPAKPKWALVPNAGACGWCQIIASRGFDYAAKGKVENTRHPHCKCTPVVDFDTQNPSLEGYSPDALSEKYKLARDQVDDTVWDEWNSLTKSEQDEYKSKRRGAFDHFKRNKIAQVMSNL